MENPVHKVHDKGLVVQPKKGMALIGMGHGFALLYFYKERYYIFGQKY